MEGEPISTDELRDSSTETVAEVAEDPAAAGPAAYAGSLAMSSRVERVREVIADDGDSMPLQVQGRAAEMHRYLRRLRSVPSVRTTRPAL